MKPMQSWDNLADWCLWAAGVWRDQWRVMPAPKGTREDPTLQKAVGLSVLKLLRRAIEPQEVPAKERPWILARLVFGAALCQGFARHQLPLGNPIGALEIVLINEWNEWDKDVTPPAGAN